MVSLCGASMQSDIIISFGWIVYCLLARRSSFPVSTIPAFAIDYQGRWSAFSVELLKLEGGGGKIKVNICDVISVALLYNTKWFGQIRTIFQSLLAGYQCSQQKDLLLPVQKRQFNSDNWVVAIVAAVLPIFLAYYLANVNWFQNSWTPRLRLDIK